MLILFLLLWIIAAILIFIDIKNESSRWAGLIAFFSGFGGLGVVWRESVVPYLSSHISNPTINYFIDLMSGLFASFAYYFAPYSFIMYSILSSEWLIRKGSKKKNIFKYILLVPVILMYIIFPVTPYYLPSFRLISLWVVPYILVANSFLIISYFKEKTPKIKQEKLLRCLILVMPTIISMFTNYIFLALGVKKAYVYNPLIIAVVFAVFIVAAVRYGIMGVKFKVEKQRTAALENVMEHITDGFIVIDEKYLVTKVNQTYIEHFGNAKSRQNFIDILNNSFLLRNLKDRFIQNINNAKKHMKVLMFECHVVDENAIERYYTVEVTPIILVGKYLEIVIMFKDITEHKKIIYLTEQNQNQRIENERLIALGQLIGGIAHNLKTPLMASSGGIEILSNHTKTIKDIIFDIDLGNQKEIQHRKEIIGEIEKWHDSLRNYVSYMDEVVNAVKGQAILTSDNPHDYFEIKEIVDKVSILMKHELRKHSCEMKFELAVDEKVKIRGNINYIVQVLNNLISNAIDSYKQKGGIIEIKIEQKFLGKIDIIVKDYGEGIRDDIKEKLFKQMFTTKGKGGTGLGLYISKSIITSKFNGEIKFESVEGRGSLFIITIPIGGDSNEEQIKYSNS